MNIWTDPWTYVALYVLSMVLVGLTIRHVMEWEEARHRSDVWWNYFASIAMLVFAPATLVIYFIGYWGIWRGILRPIAEWLLPPHARISRFDL